MNIGSISSQEDVSQMLVEPPSVVFQTHVTVIKGKKVQDNSSGQEMSILLSRKMAAALIAAAGIRFGRDGIGDSECPLSDFVYVSVRRFDNTMLQDYAHSENAMFGLRLPPSTPKAQFFAYTMVRMPSDVVVGGGSKGSVPAADPRYRLDLVMHRKEFPTTLQFSYVQVKLIFVLKPTPSESDWEVVESRPFSPHSKQIPDETDESMLERSRRSRLKDGLIKDRVRGGGGKDAWKGDPPSAEFEAMILAHFGRKSEDLAASASSHHPSCKPLETGTTRTLTKARSGSASRGHSSSSISSSSSSSISNSSSSTNNNSSSSSSSSSNSSSSAAISSRRGTSHVKFATVAEVKQVEDVSEPSSSRQMQGLCTAAITASAVAVARRSTRGTTAIMILPSSSLPTPSTWNVSASQPAAASSSSSSFMPPASSSSFSSSSSLPAKMGRGGRRGNRYGGGRGGGGGSIQGTGAAVHSFLETVDADTRLSNEDGGSNGGGLDQLLIAERAISADKIEGQGGMGGHHAFVASGSLRSGPSHPPVSKSVGISTTSNGSLDFGYNPSLMTRSSDSRDAAPPVLLESQSKRKTGPSAAPAPPPLAVSSLESLYGTTGASVFSKSSSSSSSMHFTAASEAFPAPKFSPGLRTQSFEQPGFPVHLTPPVRCHAGGPRSNSLEQSSSRGRSLSIDEKMPFATHAGGHSSSAPKSLAGPAPPPPKCTIATLSSVSLEAEYLESLMLLPSEKAPT